MGRSVAGLGAMEVWAWVVKIEKRKWRCNEKKKNGNNHYNNWTTNKIYFFSITFELQYTAKEGSAL